MQYHPIHALNLSLRSKKKFIRVLSFSDSFVFLFPLTLLWLSDVYKVKEWTVEMHYDHNLWIVTIPPYPLRMVERSAAVSVGGGSQDRTQDLLPHGRATGVGGRKKKKKKRLKERVLPSLSNTSFFSSPLSSEREKKNIERLRNQSSVRHRRRRKKKKRVKRETQAERLCHFAVHKNNRTRFRRTRCKVRCQIY